MPGFQPDCFRLDRRPALTTYLTAATGYMRLGLAGSTLKSYDSAWSYFSSFCDSFGVTPLPVDISIVCAFLVHCFESRKIQPSSIKGIVAGIQFHLRCRDPSVSSLLSNPSVRLLLNGFRKQNPGSRDKRLPVTLPVLTQLILKLRHGFFSPYIDILLESVFLSAFYGFLRCSEFCSRTYAFNPLIDLSISDLEFHAHHFSINLKHSKSDAFSKGVTVIITETNTDLCPFSSMSRYLRCRPSAAANEPLFMTDAGKVMSGPWFCTRLRLLCQACGLAPDRYTSHSFRIGAATAAASKVPVSTLKALGRWSSAAYESYVRLNLADILQAQRLMSSG